MNELNRQPISMYAKQLKVPTFNQYDEVIRQLASCDFVEKKQNVVMIGNPGTGKPTCPLPWASRPACRE